MTWEPWAPCEVEFLRQHWGTMPLKQLEYRLRREAKSLRRRVVREGLPSTIYRDTRRARMLARRERVVAMFGQGLRRLEIAAALGAPITTIDSDLEMLGLRRPLGRAPQVVAAVRRHYRLLPAHVIAARLGVTKNAVIGIARDYGLCRRRGA